MKTWIYDLKLRFLLADQRKRKISSSGEDELTRLATTEETKGGALLEGKEKVLYCEILLLPPFVVCNGKLHLTSEHLPSKKFNRVLVVMTYSSYDDHWKLFFVLSLDNTL